MVIIKVYLNVTQNKWRTSFLAERVSPAVRSAKCHQNSLLRGSEREAAHCKISEKSGTPWPFF